MAFWCALIGLAIAPSSSPSAPAHYPPSAQAEALQNLIDKSIAQGVSHPAVSVPPGDYYFGNASLRINRASNFTLRAQDGPGTVQLWFSVGAGLLVNQSSNVLLDGLSVDFDPPAHYQGTVEEVRDDGGSMIQAVVATDPGFLNPAVFDTAYAAGKPGIEAQAGAAMVWNASDPGFGAYTAASWPPATAADGRAIFNVSRATLCKDLNYLTTDGLSCAAGSEPTVRPQDKITAHMRAGFSLHLLNSTRVRTRHTAIHGAPGFAITEYDGHGAHTYLNVSVGRRHVHVVSPDGTLKYDTRAMCGRSNPTGGRLCLGLISSNNDALHSSGCKYGPSFDGGELSYCLDDWVNVHSRAQVVLERIDDRHMILIDPRLQVGASVPDNFAYGNVETLTNARPQDTIRFFLSGNLTSLGVAQIRSARRASWEDDADVAVIERAQQLLDKQFNETVGLDAGPYCRNYGCAPRVWYVSFGSDVPQWSEQRRNRGVIASLDGWAASRAAVRDSHLHHGRYGIRWKSSNATITGNRVSARYMEISPLEYYMEGPFRLRNITIADNIFGECAAPVAPFARTVCTNGTHLPLGYWRRWCSWGGGCGGICKAAAVGSSALDPITCRDIAVEDNRAQAQAKTPCEL